MWHSAWRWLYPGLRIKRWVLLFSVGLLLLVLGLTTIINYQVFGVLEEFLFRVLYEMTAGSGTGDRLHRRRYRPFETAARFENENVPFDSDRDRRRRRRFIGPPARGNGYYRAGRSA